MTLSGNRGSRLPDSRSACKRGVSRQRGGVYPNPRSIALPQNCRLQIRGRLFPSRRSPEGASDLSHRWESRTVERKCLFRLPADAEGNSSVLHHRGGGLLPMCGRAPGAMPSCIQSGPMHSMVIDGPTRTNGEPCNCFSMTLTMSGHSGQIGKSRADAAGGWGLGIAEVTGSPALIYPQNDWVTG